MGAAIGAGSAGDGTAAVIIAAGVAGVPAVCAGTKSANESAGDASISAASGMTVSLGFPAGIKKRAPHATHSAVIPASLGENCDTFPHCSHRTFNVILRLPHPRRFA